MSAVSHKNSLSPFSTSRGLDLSIPADAFFNSLDLIHHHSVQIMFRPEKLQKIYILRSKTLLHRQ
jgi:hypothetical protein